MPADWVLRTALVLQAILALLNGDPIRLDQWIRLPFGG